MNLKDAMRVERSLRMRAGSLSDLANGYTVRARRMGYRDLELSQSLKSELQSTSKMMKSTSEKLNFAIDEAMANISVDI